MELTWHNEKRRIKDLVPYVANPRQITDKQAKDLKASLDKFGVADPIIINTDNTIIGGHQRKKILETLMGVDPDFEIDVRVPDRELTIDEARELNVRLNKNVAEWNVDILANNFELDDLLDWGFEKSDLDLDLWMPDPPEDAEPQIDRAEELREIWGVETGQLWQLGSHRLICGDCTDKAVVERVIESNYNLCVTSPPYSDLRTYEIGEFNWDKLMNGFTDSSFAFMAKNSSIVVNLGQKHLDNKVDFYWNDWLEYCEKLGYPLFGLYIWSKNIGLPGNWNGRCMPSHEFIFHFKIGKIQARKWVESVTENVKKKGHNFRQKTGETKGAYSEDKIGQPYRIPYSVFDAPVQHPTDTADNEHPARFSEEFASQLIKTWSDEGQIVYDPFLGSGTTLIACERLNRKCRAVEISPAYVAVAIQRWVDVTGGVPELVHD